MRHQYPIFRGNNQQEVLDRIAQLRDDDLSDFDETRRRQVFENALRPNIRELTADEEIGINDFTIDVDATSGAVTIDLPADPPQGIVYAIGKADVSGNSVTIDANGKTINGSATEVLSAQYDYRMIQYVPGADEWRIIAEK